MRIFSIIAAIVVAIVLYFAVVDRQSGLALLQDAEAPAAAPAPDERTPEQDPEMAERVKVVVQTSVAARIDTAVSLRGETRAARIVDVKSETAAVVISDPLRKGQNVVKGEALCRLDEGARGTALEQASAQLIEARARVPEAKARLTQAQAQLSEARINQNASAKLSDSGFASTTRVANAEANVATALAAVESARAGLQAAQAGIEAAQAAVATAEKEIERLTITAPFAGLLESDTAELGALLQPGELCATVIQLNPIKLVAFVPETEVARVKLGASATATFATGQSGVTGKVTFLSRSADPTTRTFRVEVEVDNADQAISDGQTVDIQIAGEGTMAHLLPQSALTLNDDGILGIRAVNADAIVEFYPVTLLKDTSKGIWVGGLPESVDVIVLGQEYVIAGVKVDPTYGKLGQ